MLVHPSQFVSVHPPVVIAWHKIGPGWEVPTDHEVLWWAQDGRSRPMFALSYEEYDLAGKPETIVVDGATYRLRDILSDYTAKERVYVKVERPVA